MARRGWVSAETGEDTWHRLSVFDDGWVELPGRARASSDTRATNRETLRAYLLAFGMLALLYVFGNLMVSLDVGQGFLTYGGLALGLVFLGCLVYLTFVRVGALARTRQQSAGDQRQLRASKAAGRQIRRAPGTPLFRRARSAQEFADWLEGETHVRASDIVDVAATREAELHIVTVRLSDGRTRVYRSPDGKLTDLLCGLRPGVQTR